MITQAKLKIYKSFQGDIDDWARSASNKDRAMISDGDWALIDDLLQDIGLVNRGISSAEFKNSLESRLIGACDCAETVEIMRKLAWKSS